MVGRFQTVSASIIQHAPTKATEVETYDVEQFTLPTTAEGSAHHLAMSTSCTSCDEIRDERVDLFFSMTPGQV